MEIARKAQHNNLEYPTTLASARAINETRSPRSGEEIKRGPTLKKASLFG